MKEFSNMTYLEQENALMNHTNINDYINKTFSVGGTHETFYVGTKTIENNTCPTLNTYVENSTQDNYFEEMVLYDGSNTVYATILEPRVNGYNAIPYDFQMIVPENGLSTWTGSTAYYIYIELG